MSTYFNSQDAQFGRPGSPEWNLEVFRRAYVTDHGPFERVRERLKLGFSVLVYLPGPCIRAASDSVALPDREWKVLGRAENADQGVAEIWRSYTSLFGIFASWLNATQGQPKAIFENLDFLGNGHDGLDQSNEAKTALFYLTECVRTGVVLGLSDARAGALPDAIRRPFAEEVWLDDVPFARFKSIVPQSLVSRLDPRTKRLSESASWLLASRLRWTDPPRAVRIMESLPGDLGKALAAAAQATRTSDFSAPPDASWAVHRPSGFEEETLDMLVSTFILPYRSWTTYQGDDAEVKLRRLPRGLILFGPPGTGKTTIARWIADSIGLPARVVSAADLKRSDFGLTERMVRELFASARRAAPCVIVLDDADDLLPDRSKLQGDLATAEGGIVNAFLKEIEGYGGPLQGVLVILTTNRFDWLDAAARSRLSRHVLIPYPLTRLQVRVIVDSALEYYGVPIADLRRTPGEAAVDTFLEELVEFFFRAAVNTTANVTDPQKRRSLREGLFAPRDIVSAVQMLVGDDPMGEGLARMKHHYERLRDLTSST